MEVIKYGKHYTVLTLKDPKEGTFGQIINTFVSPFNETTIKSGALYNVVPLSGLDNGIGRGSSVQKIGDAGSTIEANIFLTGLYSQYRSKITNWHKLSTVLTLQLPDYLYGTTNSELSGINNTGLGNNLYVKIVNKTEEKIFGMDNTTDFTTKIILTLQEVPYNTTKKVGLLANIKNLAGKISAGIVSIENYVTQGVSALSVANIYLENAIGIISNLSQTFSDISVKIKSLNKNISTLIKTPTILALQYKDIINSIQKSIDVVSSVGASKSTTSSMILFSQSLTSYNSNNKPKSRTSFLNGEKFINTSNILNNIATGIITNLIKYIGFMSILTIIKNTINQYNNESEIKNAISLLEAEYEKINMNIFTGITNNPNVNEIFRQDVANHDFIADASILMNDTILKLKNRLAILSNTTVYMSGKNTIWDILYQNYYNNIVLDGIDINVVIDTILKANNLSFFDIIENQNILIPNVLSI